MTKNKMVMYIIWLTELYNDIRTMVITLMILLCVQWLYVVSVCLVCQPVWFSYYSAKSCPYTTITILAFVITISVYWNPFFTNPLLTIFFLVSLIAQLFAWYCAFVELFMYGPWYILLLLLVHGCFPSCFNMSSNGSVVVCFGSCSQGYSSAVVCVGFIWWLWLPFPSTVPVVHGTPSSCCTATVDPLGIET